jgi:hypothetical protein
VFSSLLPPTAGDARIAGFSITHQAAAVRHTIGYVPQALSADGTLTGYENLLIFTKLYDISHVEREERVRAALAFMGLTDSADKLVRTYLNRPEGTRFSMLNSPVPAHTRAQSPDQCLPCYAPGPGADPGSGLWPRGHPGATDESAGRQACGAGTISMNNVDRADRCGVAHSLRSGLPTFS